jgi:hypothetical protein
MTWMLTIEFGFSRSPSYRGAVKIAAAEPGYSFEGEGDAGTHRVTYGVEGLSRWERLWEKVAKWSSTSIEINGQPLNLRTFIPTRKTLDCSLRRAAFGDSVLGDKWCCNQQPGSMESPLTRYGIPCKHMGQWGGLLFHDFWAFVYKFGTKTMENKKFITYQIDRRKAMDAIESYTVMQNLTACPFYSLDATMAAVKRIPEFVTVSYPLAPGVEMMRNLAGAVQKLKNRLEGKSEPPFRF